MTGSYLQFSHSPDPGFSWDSVPVPAALPVVLDLNGNGAIDSPGEFEFTGWDPTATSDMQALRNVFAH